MSACANVWSSGKGSFSTDSIHCCTSFSVVCGGGVRWVSAVGCVLAILSHMAVAGINKPAASWIGRRHPNRSTDRPIDRPAGPAADTRTHYAFTYRAARRTWGWSWSWLLACLAVFLQPPRSSDLCCCFLSSPRGRYTQSRPGCWLGRARRRPLIGRLFRGGSAWIVKSVV